MKFLDNIKMGPKLIAAFLVTAVFTVVVGVFGISRLTTLDEADTKLYEKMTAPLGELADMQNSFQRVRVNVRDAISSGDVVEADESTIEPPSANVSEAEGGFLSGVIKTDAGLLVLLDINEVLHGE